MQCVLLQKRIVFLFLEPVRRARTFFVARAHVTRRRFSQRLRFRALECDNFLRHFLFLVRVGSGGGFLFFAVATFFIGQAEERRNRLSNA